MSFEIARDYENADFYSDLLDYSDETIRRLGLGNQVFMLELPEYSSTVVASTEQIQALFDHDPKNEATVLGILNDDIKNQPVRGKLRISIEKFPPTIEDVQTEVIEEAAARENIPFSRVSRLSFTVNTRMPHMPRQLSDVFQGTDIPVIKKRPATLTMGWAVLDPGVDPRDKKVYEPLRESIRNHFGVVTLDQAYIVK